MSITQMNTVTTTIDSMGYNDRFKKLVDCSTCEHESPNMTCSHPKAETKAWDSMTQDQCWSINTQLTQAQKYFKKSGRGNDK